MKRCVLPLCLVGVLACCKPSSPPPVVPPPLPDAGVLQGGSPVELLTRMALAANTHSMLAELVLEGSAATGGLAVTLDIFVARPGWLYAAVRGPLGPVDEVWTDGESFLWRSMRPGAGGSGRATPAVLGRLLPAPMEPSQAVGLLLGMPLPDGEPTSVDTCGAGCVALAFASGHGAQLHGGADAHPASAALDLPQHGRWTVDYTWRPQQPVPSTLSILGPAGQRARLTLQAVEANVPIPPTLFQPLADAAALLPGVP